MNTEEQDPRRNAKLVGRRLVGSPESWDRATQDALHSMGKAAAELSVPTPAHELNPYVRAITDQAQHLIATDALFAAKCEVVAQLCGERRIFEGLDVDGYDRMSWTVAAACTLLMYEDLSRAELAMVPKEGGDG